MSPKKGDFGFSISPRIEDCQQDFVTILYIYIYKGWSKTSPTFHPTLQIRYMAEII